MKASSLIGEIEKRGGTAKLVTEEHKAWDGKPRTSYHVEGMLREHDIHMFGQECDFFTVRHISKRGYYDPTSDYNSGDYKFCNRIKDLDWAIR